jgi:hypothetical protein
VNLIETFFCALGTTSNGIPYVLEAKSACTLAPTPMLLTYSADLAATGNPDTSSFHALLAGNTGHPATVVTAATARKGSMRQR